MVSTPSSPPGILTLPPEILADIAELLTDKNGLGDLCVSCKQLYIMCSPVRTYSRHPSTTQPHYHLCYLPVKILYRDVSSDSSQWKIILDAGPGNLPTWSRHIRTLKLKVSFDRDERRVIPVEFEPLFPILEQLPGLRTLASNQFINNPKGIEELAHRLPWLQKFECAGWIDIDRDSDVKYTNSFKCNSPNLMSICLDAYS